MPDRRILKLLRLLLYASLAILGIYLSLKFILPWTAPFILAFLTAMLLEPAVNYIEKRFTIKRWFISALLTLTFLSLIFLLGQFITVRAVNALSDFMLDLPETLSSITTSFSWIGDKIYSYIESAPANIREYLETAIKNILLSINKLPGELSGTALKFLSNVVSYMPKILLFLGTYAVGTFFISSRFGEVRSFLLQQIPRQHQYKLNKLKSGVFGTLTKWLKAQLMLISVTFLELTAGFLLLRIEHPLLIALIVAIIDALPVLGVGTILIPWAIFQLIRISAPAPSNPAT